MPSQVTVQGDAKVTLYVTGLDGTAVNLAARTDGLALPRNGLKHFLSLKARPEAADHEDRLSRSCWRAAPSSSDITTLYTLVSFANIATLLLRIEPGRLFTYNKKTAGPSIDPCGTPEVTGRSRDVAPSTVTRWRLP